MADINFSELAAQLPTDAIVENAGKVMIDVTKVTGNTADSLTSETVGEALSKLLLAANLAQTAYNADPLNTVAITGYGSRTLGAPVLDSIDSLYYARSTQSLATRIPLSMDTVTAA
jgi:hypothetical protein